MLARKIIIFPFLVHRVNRDRNLVSFLICNVLNLFLGCYDISRIIILRAICHMTSLVSYQYWRCRIWGYGYERIFISLFLLWTLYRLLSICLQVFGIFIWLLRKQYSNSLLFSLSVSHLLLFYPCFYIYSQLDKPSNCA